MKYNFKTWNTILGWFSFLVGLIVYTLTVEPTVSYWDCGEYISTSSKLQVGHPPGAPLFQIVGAVASLFAISKEHIALMVNLVSVLSSAFTLLLMFWSSTMIFQKVVTNYLTDTWKGKAILGASLVGTLSFCFTDSFWFNAVEAEVYAMASLFIALLFWLGLKWEQNMDSSNGNKWLLAISFVVGLSFGVHFMALLTIPSIGLLYYFKHYPNVTIKNFVVANALVVLVLLLIFKLLLPWTLAIFGLTEVFMINSIGLPFNSGTIFAAVVLISLLYFGIKKTQEKKQVFINTILLSIVFIFIGFSSWMMLPIRANAKTVINENNPSDARELLAYYNREQYPSNPLFYGPQFTDMFAGPNPDNPYKDKPKNFERNYETKRYDIVNDYKETDFNSSPDHMALLPRMVHESSAENYLDYIGGLDFRKNPNFDYVRELEKYGIDVEEISESDYYALVGKIDEDINDRINKFKQGYRTGQYDNEDLIDFLQQNREFVLVDKPSFFHNISFMVEYQFVYMYWRYLLWNFVGRQNDNQGRMDDNGNWLSGIKFIDELFVISQTDLPEDHLNNKARNTYFFIPFLLGLIGIWYHSKKEWKSFYVLLVLFLFTGLILKIYLNEKPFEPRERDYALVGSFYIFAMWIGFGVYAIFEALKKYLSPKIVLPLVLLLTMLGSPVLLAVQNWDDHDRSNRYTALANAKAYLDSCEENAILYTIGDNDTFPLWYAQEIEGYRTDVRIVNTSLLQTDWYIDQMKAKAYESEPLPISLTKDLYVGDRRDVSIYRPLTEERIDIHQFLDFVKDDSEKTKVQMQNNSFINFFPTKKIRLQVDKDNVIKHKAVSEKYYDSIVPYIDINISGNLVKNRLVMLDILANNNWERPTYFSGGSFSDEDYLWMKDYLQLQGLVYKLVPVKTKYDRKVSGMEMGSIDADKMYNIVTKWDWGNGDSPNIYHDPETRRNALSYRTNLARLAQEFINEDNLEKAEKVLDLSMEKVPMEFFGFYSTITPLAYGYYEVNKKEKARKIIKEMIRKYSQEAQYHISMPREEKSIYFRSIATKMRFYQTFFQVAKDNNDLDYFKKDYDVFVKQYQTLDKDVRFRRFGLSVELDD